MSKFQDTKDLLTNIAATGIGSVMDVADFRHLVMALDTSGNASLTLKVMGSIQEAKPDFSAAASQSNQWSYIQIIDLADQSVVNGATGVVLTGTDTHRLLELNTNGLKWITVNITAYAAGNVWVRIKPFNDSA